MSNPRYWASQWYTTKFAKEPWPGGWYWHDHHYNWNGPFDTEHEANDALQAHLELEREESDARERERAQFELYYHPKSPYSQKVLIAIYEKDAQFKRNIVNLRDDSERARFRELYPMGKLPVIELNHGPLIPESSVIIEYLDSLGGKRLISSDPDVARKTRFKDRFLDFYLTDSVAAIRSECQKSDADQDRERLETLRYRIGAVYDFMEYELKNQTWASGERFSLADCTAAAALAFAEETAPFAEYPSLAAYAERLGNRPSVARVRDEAGD